MRSFHATSSPSPRSLTHRRSSLYRFPVLSSLLSALLPSLLGGCNITTPTAATSTPARPPQTATLPNSQPNNQSSNQSAIPAAIPDAIPGDNNILTAQATPPARTGGQATTNITRITFATEGADFDPCVSADGAHLFFASTQHRDTSDIYVKRTNSKVLTQLTTDPSDDAMPAISPDGTKLAFASNRAGNWDIYIMPARGGKAVQLTSDSADETSPSWAPDGQRLVYARFNDSPDAHLRSELWVTNPANNATANFIGYGVAPRWCPVPATGANASDKILFQLSRERGRRAYGIWTLDYADGLTSNITQIQSASDVALLHPTWSNDGNFIAYAQVDLLDPANRTDRPMNTSLWMASISGEAAIRLTHGDGAPLSPAWASDDSLYYVSARAGSDNIWAFQLAPALGAAHAILNSAPASSPTLDHANASAAISQPATTQITTASADQTPDHPADPAP